MRWLLLLFLLAWPAWGEVTREYVAVRNGDLNEVKTLLATLVLNVKYANDLRQNTLILEGEPVPACRSDGRLPGGAPRITVVSLRAPGLEGRSLVQVLRVKDGDTIVVSGLITSRELEPARTFPHQLELPHWGPLLQNMASRQWEPVLMLTPHIMK